MDTYKITYQRQNHGNLANSNSDLTQTKNYNYGSLQGWNAYAIDIIIYIHIAIVCRDTECSKSKRYTNKFNCGYTK